MSYSTASNAAAAGSLKGTGRSGKGQSGAEQEIFWSPSTFAFANRQDAVSLAAWNAAVAAGNLFYLGVIEEFDANDVEPTYYESPNGNLRLKTANAKRVRQYRFVENSATHAALRSFDGQTGRLFIRTKSGYVKARIEDDGTVRGLATSQFDVGLLTAATSDTPAFTPVDVTYAAPSSDDEDIFEDRIDFEFSEVDQVYPADLVASAISTSGTTLDFTLAVELEGTDSAIAGVTEGMLSVKDINGNVLTKTVVANGNKYDVSVTTALTQVVVAFDGVQTIGGTLYSSGDLSVKV